MRNDVPQWGLLLDRAMQPLTTNCYRYYSPHLKDDELYSLEYLFQIAHSCGLLSGSCC